MMNFGEALEAVKSGKRIVPHLDLKNAQGVMQPGWSPSQSDLFAEDWIVV
ncbi:Thoeris anti-defense Tad2 family protein [Xenorhabdus hominickii]|uniref:Thoeris anti-defense 2-like domain-containing protein n=1 Tax=Xenorhabdus hominickii TaxID=351679 RepID=A0A1V0M3Z1_XENHO|nr:MW1434 family type I TA system toxin [Xenorhabdus hominickii]ARD69575.1 hypothetical protein [Xenorhabdus hominickii]PHM52406.1 hypothetical protein Xhom_04484 [Xenorhabdus hominickii]